MPARREKYWYNVAILTYSSPKTRAMAERGEDITGQGRIRSQVMYSGDSWREARAALGDAVARANRLKLAYAVQVLRDYELFILVNVEHF
jgi:hypothetical protein